MQPPQRRRRKRRRLRRPDPMQKDGVIRSPSASDKRHVLVGRIGAAHGVKGEVRLVSFTEDPKAIGNYGPLSNSRRTRRFEIVALRALKEDLFVAHFAGVTTRDAAEALKIQTSTSPAILCRRRQMMNLTYLHAAP